MVRPRRMTDCSISRNVLRPLFVPRIRLLHSIREQRRRLGGWIGCQFAAALVVANELTVTTAASLDQGANFRVFNSGISLI